MLDACAGPPAISPWIGFGTQDVPLGADGAFVLLRVPHRRAFLCRWAIPLRMVTLVHESDFRTTTLRYGSGSSTNSQNAHDADRTLRDLAQGATWRKGAPPFSRRYAAQLVEVNLLAEWLQELGARLERRRTLGGK